jgi:hypothetical protein
MVLNHALSLHNRVHVLCVNRPTPEFSALQARWRAHPLVEFLECQRRPDEAGAHPTSTMLWRHLFGNETSDDHSLVAVPAEARVAEVPGDFGSCDCVLVLEAGLISDAWLKGHDSPPEFCVILKVNLPGNYRLARSLLADGRYVPTHFGQESRDGYVIARRRMNGRRELGVSGVLNLVEVRNRSRSWPDNRRRKRVCDQ